MRDTKHNLLSSIRRQTSLRLLGRSVLLILLNLLFFQEVNAFAFVKQSSDKTYKKTVLILQEDSVHQDAVIDKEFSSFIGVYKDTVPFIPARLNRIDSFVSFNTYTSLITPQRFLLLHYLQTNAP